MPTNVFTPSAELEEFRSSVRRFAEANADSRTVRRLMDTAEGYDPGVWKQMSGQLGLQGLHLPEEYGGSGVGFVELVIVFEELGRTLLPSPYLATVALGANAILQAGTEEQRARWLPGIAAGEKIATLAYAEAIGGPDGLTIEAGASGGGYTLTGHARHVVDGLGADLIVLPARVDGVVGLFLVEGGPEGLHRTAMPGMDLTRRQARLDLDGVPATRLGEGSDAGEVLRRILDQAAVCLSAEMLGGAQVCLDMAVGYSRDRYQFGRPIGSFQAVKHRCADMLVDVESARSAVQYAAWTAEHEAEELATVAAVTKAFTSQAYVDCANRNIYVHGGIGFTWEHDAHLYLRRATSSAAMLGGARRHRAELARQLIDA